MINIYLEYAEECYYKVLWRIQPIWSAYKHIYAHFHVFSIDLGNEEPIWLTILMQCSGLIGTIFQDLFHIFPFPPLSSITFTTCLPPRQSTHTEALCSQTPGIPSTMRI